MLDFEQSLAEMLEALHLSSRSGVSWFGEPVLSVNAVTQRGLSLKSFQEQRTLALSDLLYENYFTTGRAVLRRQSTYHYPAGSADFMARLSMGNHSPGTWQAGWVIRAIAPEIIIERDGLRLRTSESHVRTEADLTVGAVVDALLPNERLYLSPGFYMAMGMKDDSPNFSIECLRYYWHLTAPGAALFVSLVTDSLNAAGIAFRMKVLNDPNTFRRCDAGVVYVAWRDKFDVDQIMLDIYPEILVHLRPTVPALTKLILPGLSVAVDPEGGASFGQSRCRIIADGVLRAHSNKVHAIAQRLDCIKAAFAENGVDLQAPYGVLCDLMPEMRRT